MIENLNGIHETVNYKTDTYLRLYMNDKCESFPEHWHTPIEIIMPTVGDYEICIGNRSELLHPGEIILICPGVIHSLSAVGEGERIIFQAELSILHSIRELDSVISLITPALTISPECSPTIHARMHDLLLEIAEEYNNSILPESSIYSRLLEMFVLIGRNYTSNTTQFDVSNQRQKEYAEKFIFICNYISDHCSEDLSLDDIANIAGFSKYHFTRLFKEFTNITFYKYLNQKRIAHAELLLADSSIPITEVALHSGFSSLSAFIRMFKMIKKCTPTEYRNMYINTSVHSDHQPRIHPV